MGHEFLGGREVVGSECDLIIEENRLLKRCLRLLRDNSALEIATILSAVIAFCDGKFRQKFAAEFSNVLEESAARREEGAPGQRAAGTIPTKYARPPSGIPPPRSFAEEMYYGFPEQWDLPERDKWTQTTFPPPLFWPRFKKQIRYDTSGHTAHIRSHLNTQTPLTADLEYDPYYLKSLVLASYYRALANRRRGQDSDYSIYYPIFRRLSVPSVMHRMFRFPHGILFGHKLGKKWRLRPLRTSGRSSRGRSKSRRRRNRTRSPYEDDVEIIARIGKRKANQENLRGAQAADAGQHLGAEFASYGPGGQNDFQGQLGKVLSRAAQNMQVLEGQTLPDQGVSVTVTHEHTDTTYYNDGTASLVHDTRSKSHNVPDAHEEGREQAAAGGVALPDTEEATSTSNNNPQDFSSSSCGRPESRLTQQRYTPIDPLYKLGRRSRAGFYAEGAPTRRGGGQRQNVQTAQRAYESDYGASTGSDNSGRSHFDSAVRTSSSPRTPCLKSQSHDSDQCKPSTSRQGRQDETRGRTFGGAVGSRFEPQAFSSPHGTTFDQRLLDAEYDSEGDRNLSSNTPPSVHPYEIPEKNTKKESWESGKSSYEYSTPIQSQYGGGSSEYLSGRGEHAQSRTEHDVVSEQKSPTVVSDGDGAGAAYSPPSLTPRSRQVRGSQGAKSLVPAVYTPSIRSHGGSQQPSLYEVNAESRAGSDAASVGSSSHASLAQQSLVLKDHKLGVLKSAWTASSTSLHVASQCSSQLLPAALASSGKNLLGEIAFQLERRILDYVFCNSLPPAEPDDSALARKRRFYGYTVNNIGEMINREALAGDYYSKGTERMLRERLRTLLDILTPLGYDLADHARFSQDIINKYGLLPHPPVGQPGDMDTEVGICGVETHDLQHAIVFMSESETERSNLLLILDCLRMLAIEDGRPLFVW